MAWSAPRAPQGFTVWRASCDAAAELGLWQPIAGHVHLEAALPLSLEEARSIADTIAAAIPGSLVQVRHAAAGKPRLIR